MANVWQPVVSALVYPGLVSMVLLGALYAQIQRQHPAYGRGLAALTQVWRSREGLLLLLSLLLAAIAPALLPWPYHPAAVAGLNWFWALLLLEAAWILPAIPAMLSNVALLARPALRELQLGIAARMLLWFALGLALSSTQAPLLWPAHLLALLGALTVLPIALGLGPYAVETNITAGGVYHGWPNELHAVIASTSALRRAATLAATLVGLLPLALLPDWAGLPILLAAFVLASVLLRRIASHGPRLTLPAALRRCWVRSLPLSAAAALYLIVVGRL